MKLFFSFCLIFVAMAVNAQSFTISADMMQIAYVGARNPLTIVSDNTDCANITATTDNGIIEKGDGCHFYFFPYKKGQTTITVRKEQNGKSLIIATPTIRTKVLPDIEASVGNKSGGLFAIELFKLQNGVNITAPNCDFDIRCKVTSFTISIIRNKQLIFNEAIWGNLFTSKTKNSFNQLKPDDIVSIENIRAISPDGITRTMAPLSFTMR